MEKICDMLKKLFELRPILFKLNNKVSSICLTT